MLTNNSVRKNLYNILTDEKLADKKEQLFQEGKNCKLILLWQILYETDVNDTELLKERIYQFGSKVKEKDYWGRDIFLFLVAFLNLVIK